MHAIREGLDGMDDFPHSAAWEGYTEWTKRVFTTLCTIGRETLGCQVGARSDKVKTGTHLDYGEFLYDVTWLQYDAEGWLVSAPLVVECEWSSYLEAIEEDFSKLLLACASVRLMICRQRPDMKPEDMGNYLAGYVQRLRDAHAEDVYLLHPRLLPRRASNHSRKIWNSAISS